MTKDELKGFHTLLISLRSRVNGDVSHLADEALGKNQQGRGDLSSMPIHMADVGTDNFEQEFTLNLLANEEQVLKEIAAALDRIADGKYGRCEECQGPIPKARLKEIPYTRFCVACARKLEETS